MNQERCIVGSLIGIRPHPTRPDLDVGEIDGHQIVVGRHYEEGQLGFYIPDGASVPQSLLKDMWLFNQETGKGRLAGKR